MISPRQHQRMRAPDKAFSLVETAMAIGIVSFALTGLMGVLPVALRELGTARNDVVVAELAQGYVAKASQMDFSKIGTLAGTQTLHDESGAPTTDSDRARYQVQMNIQLSSTHTRTVLISVYRQPHGSSETALAKFVSVVSDNGR